MDVILSKLFQGPNALLEYVASLDEFDDLIIGILISLDQNLLKSELKLLNVFLKILESQYKNKELVMTRYLQVFRIVIKKINSKSALYILTNFLEHFERIGKKIESLSEESGDFLDKIIREYELLFEDLINLYKSEYEVIKFVKIVKDMPNLLKSTKFEMINIEETVKLIDIIDTEEIYEGCVVIHKLCKCLSQQPNETVNVFVEKILIFLIGNKAKEKDIKNIQYNLNLFHNLFSEESKISIRNSFLELCNKFNQEPSQEFFTNFGTYNNFPTSRKNKNLENKSALKNEIIEEIKKEDKKDLEKNSVYEERKRENSEKKVNLQQKIMTFEGKHSEKSLEVSTKSQICKNPHFPSEKNNVPIPIQIEEIISNAESLYKLNQQINKDFFLDQFNKLKIDSNPSTLFKTLDEIMAKGRPTQEKAQFWKIMLKIIDKVPHVSNYEMLTLWEKLKTVKGFVRDNKEKVSKIKENKEKYKEELKNNGVFREGFKNGDRELKRAQKLEQKLKNEAFPSENHEKKLVHDSKSPKNNLSAAQIQLKSDTESMSTYLSDLSESALSIIRSQSIDESFLSSIYSSFCELKSKIVSFSSTCKAKIFGSSIIGTCLKFSMIDVLLVDPDSDLNSILFRIFPEIHQESQETYILNSQNSPHVFKIHTKDLLYLETSKLLQKYSLLDRRVPELIMFCKVLGHKLDLKFVSGFHWTLMAINFLQHTDPFLVPSLQTKSHKEKIVQNVDTWFDLEYSKSSNNTCTLGQLIFLFLEYFCNNQNFVGDIKAGKNIINENSMFLFKHPFLETEIGSLEQQLTEKLKIQFKNAFECVINQRNFEF